jgi:hypothetical protein
VVLLVIAVVALLAGCSHGTKPVNKPASTEPPKGALRGDVDGDGEADDVSIARRCPSESQCRTYLVVRTRDRKLTRALTTAPVPPPVPFLDGLAALGSDRALKIVATTWMGASTAFARVFSVRKGRISEIVLQTGDGTFPYAGSVTHWDGVDCVRGQPGTIVAKGQFVSGERRPVFVIERRYYRVGPHSFKLVRIQREKTSTPADFASEPLFPSCMRVRAG